MVQNEAGWGGLGLGRIGLGWAGCGLVPTSCVYLLRTPFHYFPIKELSSSIDTDDYFGQMITSTWWEVDSE